MSESDETIPRPLQVVSSTDFAAYMKYHNKRLFLPHCSPKPLCYAIRRPGRFPDGDRLLSFFFPAAFMYIANLLLSLIIYVI